MRRQSVLVLVLFALMLFPAAGQVLIPGNGGGGGNRDGTYHGKQTFPVPMRLGPVLAGAPFSGEPAVGTVQTLADGTHVTHSMGVAQKIYRDSQGRVRMERSVSLAPTFLKNVPTVIEISDPVAGFDYIVDNVAHVVHRTALPHASVRSDIGNTPLSGAPLEAQTIDGVPVTGTRRTSAMPSGTMTVDSWYSPDLHLIVRTVTTDPLAGVTTIQIGNLSRVEPEPTLFQVPLDYSVVDETKPFTIEWGAQ